MKQRLFTAAILLFSLGLSAQPVKEHGQLRLNGIQLVNAQDRPVALHGMSFGWHNLWPRFYNAGAVTELVDKWHCTVVRASMGIELNDSGYLKNPAGAQRLMEQVIDACISKGVYVIADWHDHNIHQAGAIRFFDAMSKKYGHTPNIIYEIFNEPDYETWAEVKAYSEAVIKAIRANDPDNIILVGSPRWDQNIHEPAADPIKGHTNLMYTMHFYAGTHKEWLRKRTDSAMAAGLPVFISECAGMEATGDGPIDTLEWQRFVQWMDSKALSWVAWSVSDKNETCSVLTPAARSNGRWKNKQIKTWGQLTRKELLRYQKTTP